jgi:hypothetical protein
VRRTRSSARALAGLAALAAAGLAGGCGGDGEKKPSSTVERVYRVPTAGQTTPEDVPVNPAPSTPDTTPTEPQPPQTSTSPEAQPGGGGDEEPARTEVALTATRAGGIRPRRAGVAPYISVRITLTSKDGSPHTLSIGGQRLRVGGTRKGAFVVLSGLRPGRSYRGVADGGRRVTIASTAEPGP